MADARGGGGYEGGLCGDAEPNGAGDIGLGGPRSFCESGVRLHRDIGTLTLTAGQTEEADSATRRTAGRYSPPK